jgi:hypothetical protein
MKRCLCRGLWLVGIFGGFGLPFAITKSGRRPFSGVCGELCGIDLGGFALVYSILEYSMSDSSERYAC